MRQRRWALADLVTYTALRTHPRRPRVADVSAALLTQWVGAAGSVSSARARAAAARALLGDAVPGDAVAVGVGRRPRGPLSIAHPSPVVGDADRGRLLLARLDAGPPPRFPQRLWVRFAAHTYLASATAAPERVLAHLPLSAVDAGIGQVRTPTGEVVRLPGPARAALRDWVGVRREAVSALTGSAPSALWVRLHPSRDRRRGTLAPAGLPISPRGLRLAFTTATSALASQDPRLRGVEMRDVRAAAWRA